MSRTDFNTLLEAGAHFGHLKRKWNPKMAPYIFMEKNGIHIIDLHKTVLKIDEAAAAIKQIAKSGRRVLFVATKKQAKDIVAEKVAAVGMPYVTERWAGGMLTNFPTIRKAVKKMATIDKMTTDGTFDNFSKREKLQISRQRAKLEKNLGSIADLTRLPAALFVVDVQKEANAVKVQAEKMIAEQDAALAIQQAEMKVKADAKKAEADAAYSIQQETQRKTIEVTRVSADIARKEKEAELADREIAIQERRLDAEVRKQADAMKYKAEKEAEAELVRRQRDADARAYEVIKEAEARKAEAEALRFAMEQEAEGIRAKGLAEAEAIEKKAEAQKKMGEASVLEMYLDALPEVVKNAAAPLAQTDRIVMYGDGNSTKLVKDVMSSASQVMDGVKESTGLDLTALLAGVVGGKMAASQPVTVVATTIPALMAVHTRPAASGEWFATIWKYVGR